MQISVTGKHVEISPAMEDYAQKKCERISRYYDRVQKVDILVDKPSREFVVEVIAHVDRHDPFIARDMAEDFYACMDAVMDKISRQASEHKEKVRNRKHPG